MSTPGNSPLTAEQYLAIERPALERHEFYRGVMTQRDRSSLTHSRIATNLIYQLANQLDRTACHVLALNMRVFVRSIEFFCYPDLMITCGPPELLDAHEDNLLNPIVLLEILSDSTEAYDRGEKFRRYQAIPSLKTYILVSQKGMAVDIFDRRPDDPSAWTLRSATGPDGVLRIDSLPTPIAIPLSDVYYGLDLPPIPPVPPDADR
jgi:Uma2 family endonuclease